jgi:hypothetical protein
MMVNKREDLSRRPIAHNIARSEEWYKGDDFWFQIASDPVYRAAMLEAENALLEEVCATYKDKLRGGALVALGPGDGSKELFLHRAVGAQTYMPISVNQTELNLATTQAENVVPILAEFQKGLERVAMISPKLIYLGNTYSNLSAMGYDLLASIDRAMSQGDRLYVSAQTSACTDKELLLKQYEAARTLHLHDRMCHTHGVQAGERFVQFNTETQDVEIGAFALTSSGRIAAGDKIITVVSHKPVSLYAELRSRFENYEIALFHRAHNVSIAGTTYRNRFEAAVLTKSS